MKERERLVVGGLVSFFLVLWLGFLVHRSPRFAGSAWGGALAVSGSALMLVPLAYMVVKRIPPLKKRVAAKVPMRTLLTWHVYAGILGPILVLLHTGHKFESPLGTALTALTIVVVLSGFTGRHLMSRFSREIREKKETLTRLELAYRQTAGELAARPEEAVALRPFAGFWRRLGAGFSAQGRGAPSASVRALRIADAIADLEYAVRTHETFKRAFSRWLRFHIALSALLYVLLALHVWAGIHFGLRWFEAS